MYIFRWDLDKTYLQTDFDSVRGLVRAALEPAEAKRNVPGSGALLRALSERGDSRVIILSGSPTQMREVLARKLEMDGVRFDELHLKDNLGNLRRGRFRAVRGQFGYKLPHLLRGRRGVGRGARESLFGDDAEVDALVYSVFADAIARRLRPEDVSRILEAAGAYPEQIAETLSALEQVPVADVVDRIFIHLDRGVPPARFSPLGPRVIPVHSWFQAALVLYGAGQLRINEVQAVTREVVASDHLEPSSVANLFQDIIRRGHVRPQDMARLVAEMDADPAGDTGEIAEVIRLCQRRVAWLRQVDRYRPPEPLEHVDYLGLVHHFGRKVSQE